MEFNYEIELVEKFIKNLKISNLGYHKCIQHITEFDYRNGRPDIVFLDQFGEIVSIEAKLSNWRKAMDQAYRNTCFSDFSYILLPENKINIALRYQKCFTERSVGICHLRNNKIFVSLSAQKTQPLFDWLKNKAIVEIKSGGFYGLAC